MYPPITAVLVVVAQTTTSIVTLCPLELATPTIPAVTTSPVKILNHRRPTVATI